VTIGLVLAAGGLLQDHYGSPSPAPCRNTELFSLAVAFAVRSAIVTRDAAAGGA